MSKRTLLITVILAVVVLLAAGKCSRDYTPQHGPGGGSVDVPVEQPAPAPPQPHWPTGHEKGYW